MDARTIQLMAEFAWLAYEEGCASHDRHGPEIRMANTPCQYERPSYRHCHRRYLATACPLHAAICTDPDTS